MQIGKKTSIRRALPRFRLIPSMRELGVEDEICVGLHTGIWLQTHACGGIPTAFGAWGEGNSHSDEEHD